MSNQSRAHYSVFNTSVGPLYVAYTGTTVRYTGLGILEERFRQECHARLGTEPAKADAPPEPLRRAVQRFLDGKGPFRGRVDLSGLSMFQQRVLHKTMEIRKGEVRPYHWIARELDAPRAMRAVGTALARNPIPLLIPCHRVVRADYRLGQYGSGGPNKKREILRYEGVDVDRLDQLAHQGVRFTGSKTTRIFCVLGCYTGRRVKEQHRVSFASADAARAAGFRPCKVCRPA